MLRQMVLHAKGPKPFAKELCRGERDSEFRRGERAMVLRGDGIKKKVFGQHVKDVGRAQKCFG